MEVSFHPFGINIRTMEEQLPSCDRCNGVELEPTAAAVPPPSSSSSSDLDLDLLRCQRDSFLAGFRDCRREAVRYLVNVEQVPLVLGLERHLTELETCMQSSLDRDLLSRTEDTFCPDLQGTTDEDDDEAAGSFINCQTTTGVASLLDEEEFGEVSKKDFLVSDRRTADEAAAYQPDGCSFIDSGCDSSLTSSSSTNLSVDYEASTTSSPAGADSTEQRLEAVGESPETTTMTISESELAENALELMHLAHNNPRIHRILNELFVLMDSDYDDDDDDHDDDDDDGIEMKENDGMNSDSLDDY